MADQDVGAAGEPVILDPAVLDRVCADRKIQILPQKLLFHFLNGKGELPDADLWVDVRKLPQLIHEKVLNRTSNGQNVLIPRIHLADGFRPFFQLTERELDIGQEHLTVCVEFDFSFSSVKQGYAQLRLQPGKILAQSRLGDIQLLRRTGQISVTRDGAEILQVGKIHCHHRFKYTVQHTQCKEEKDRSL